MGDSGDFDASVGIRYSLMKKEKNTVEDAKAFLAKKKFIITSEEDEVSEERITELFERGDKFTLTYKEDWTENNTDDGLAGLLECFDEYYEKEFYRITFNKEATVEDVMYLNLELAEGLSEIDESFNDIKNILSVSGDIYCGNDNSEEDSTNINNILEYLKLPGAKLVLAADGNGNC